MNRHRMSMLIVQENGCIARMLGNLFAARFDRILATSGVAALDEIRRRRHFDICIMEILLGVESPQLHVNDAQMTGIRLIKYMLEHGVSQRFLVLTGQLGLQDEVKRLVDGQGAIEYLHASDVENEGTILRAVDRLMGQRRFGRAS